MTVFRIHSLDHGRAVLNAACEAGKPVTLISPQASQAGVGWWRELVRLLREEFPGIRFDTVLDCGPSPGLALAGIRAGAEAVSLTVDAAVMAKIASIAEQAGTHVESLGAECGGYDALDLLGMPDPALYCGKALGS